MNRVTDERLAELIAVLLRQRERLQLAELPLDEIDDCVAALRELQSLRGDGYVRVPREPTDAMVWAGCDRGDECEHCPARIETPYGWGVQGCRSLARETYRAMLDAALKADEP